MAFMLSVPEVPVSGSHENPSQSPAGHSAPCGAGAWQGRSAVQQPLTLLTHVPLQPWARGSCTARAGAPPPATLSVSASPCGLPASADRARAGGFPSRSGLSSLRPVLTEMPPSEALGEKLVTHRGVTRSQNSWTCRAHNLNAGPRVRASPRDPSQGTWQGGAQCVAPEAPLSPSAPA